ncbi:MAG: hypothetical protein OSB09_03235 [Planctomycetota bacterium]|nr:hypothetical protein [Planctomycetota bacterium]
MGRVSGCVTRAIVLMLLPVIVLVSFADAKEMAVGSPASYSSNEGPVAEGPVARGAKQFIRKGVPQGVFVIDGGWEIEGKKYVGAGKNKMVIADHTLEAGNFDIEIKMTLNKVGANYAGVQFGQGRLVLGGDGGKLIFRGYPKKDRRVEIGSLADRVTQGKAIQVRIRRRGSQLLLFLDGKRIHSEQGISGPIGEFGIIAGDGPTEVESFRASGNLRSSGRKQRIDRVALKSLDRDERITRSIEGGIDFILDMALADPAGVSPSRPEAVPGARAVEAYALIVAGIDVGHPVVRSHLEACSQAMPSQRRIYDVSCWAFALDAAITQAEQDALLLEPELEDIHLLKLARKHRKDLQVAAEIILGGQNATGGWRYLHSAQDADTSVTQFASLAVGVFARRGIEIPDECWVGMTNYCLSVQMPTGEEVAPLIVLEPERETGEEESRGRTGVVDEEVRPLSAPEMQQAWKRGFHYADKAPKSGNWNMSCAGVSSLLVSYRYGKESFTPELRQKVRESLRDGVAWIEADWKPHDNFYGMYSLEKVGDLGEVHTFGEHDWYLEMSNYLLDRQQNEGNWGPGKATYHGESDRLNTSLALLILKRASALLTRGPRDVVIYTGGIRAGQGLGDDWVLIPRLGTSVHLPSLVRTLRLRPKPQMLRMLEEMVEALPSWRRPTMVPYLALVRERVNSRGVRKILERCEESIRPTGFADPDEMAGWYQIWRRARQIGEDQLPEAGDELIGIAEAAAGDPVLRETAIRAALQLGLQKSARLMVQDLASEHFDLRMLGYQGIRSLFSDSPPDFDPDESAGSQQPQIEKIRSWVESRL